MKFFTVSTLVLSTLLVLIWPIVVFFSGFLFDAPLHGSAETWRWIEAYAIWTYPLGYLVAIGYVILIAAKSKRPGVPWWAPPTGFLFLIPIAHFFLALSMVFR